MELLAALRKAVQERENQENVDGFLIGSLYGMLMFGIEGGEQYLRDRITEIQQENERRSQRDKTNHPV